MRAPTVLVLCTCLVLAGLACDTERINLDGDRGDGSGGGGEDGGEGPGGGGGGPCQPTQSQCNNCMDDDGDGRVDGDDPHCTGASDNDEATFDTGISGDNSDGKKQDCFYDGNSGGCQVPTCCLLPAPCDEDTYGGFDPADCDRAADCAEECAPLTPPGCDCFGCCTICAPGTGECFDILISTGISPDCTLEGLADDTCVKCVKSELCTSPDCDPEACVLCPGQSQDDLPPGCAGESECPPDYSSCQTSADCEGNDYCSNGCCLVGVD